MTALEYLGRLYKILESAVGAGADHALVDLHLSDLVDRSGVLRQMRERHGRLELA